jgi:hypothetical protein
MNSSALFYHASSQIFKNGDLLTNPSPVTTGPNAVRELQAARPPGAPARDACFFACENPENAVRFLEAERAWKGTLASQHTHVYTVQFPAGLWKGPMAIIGAIEKRVAAGAPPFNRLVTEYWTQTLTWQFFEVFGPEMLIVSSVSAPSFASLCAATIRYQGDHSQAASL